MKSKFPASGFTLVEMLIAMGIGALIIGLSLDSFIFLYKNSTMAVAYRNVHEDARKSLAWFNRDVRAATGVVSWVSNNITLAVMNSTGGIDNIHYFLSNSQLQRTSTGSYSNSLTENTTWVDFTLFNRAGGTTTSPTNTYEIRLMMTVSNVTSYRVISDLLQTRVRMRNKP